MTKKSLVDNIVFHLEIHTFDKKYVRDAISKYEREKYKPILKKCKEAIQENLAKRQYKNEVVLLEAWDMINKIMK